MTAQNLVDRLAANRHFANVPREQLAWLASRGQLRDIPAGELLVREGDPIEHIWIILSGRVVVRLGRGAQARKAMEWGPGDLTGILPYSRARISIGFLNTEERSEVFLVGQEHIPEMIRDCHELTASFVHAMLDRARTFASYDLQNERLMSLGRLSARLAHELNNPAAAVARSAESLGRRLSESLRAFRSLGAARLPEADLAAIDRAIDACVDANDASVRSPIEQLDREDEFTDWLSDHDLDVSSANALAESPLSLKSLDELAGRLDPATLDVTLRALAEGCSIQKLTDEIEQAATRIHDLVAAVKGFSYMDQAMAPKPVDVGRGLSDTTTVLNAKARQKSIKVVLTVPPDLPKIQGFGGELNQVWANILDNALDAAPQNGLVEVSAAVEGDVLVVRIIDNGPGIPDEIRSRLFEPFFTTKPVGSGTGLGLDIARRLVERHDGQIEVHTRPGRTEFRVKLPMTMSTPAPTQDSTEAAH